MVAISEPEEESVETVIKGARSFALLQLMLAVAFIWSVPAKAQDVAATYKKKCAVCHGASGKGDTVAGKKLGAHDLTSSAVQKQPDSDLLEVVAKGKKMPAYEGKLKPEEMQALVDYIRQLGKGK